MLSCGLTRRICGWPVGVYELLTKDWLGRQETEYLPLAL
jgi:hypothetical protein